MSHISKHWQPSYFGTVVRDYGMFKLCAGPWGNWYVDTASVSLRHYHEGKEETQAAAVKAAEAWLRSEIKRWKLTGVTVKP